MMSFPLLPIWRDAFIYFLLHCSRILDDTEVLVGLNLDAAARNDYGTVDANPQSGRRQAH
jgi:hypothetical protein